MKTTERKCRRCAHPVDLDQEGHTYPDGTCAHDHCHDTAQVETDNAEDWRD